MSTQILTTDDLREFKVELLEEIKHLMKTGEDLRKKWLKTKEVTELLKISPNTLQNLRASRQLAFAKIGGTIYYDFRDIEEMMEAAKRKKRNRNSMNLV